MSIPRKQTIVASNFAMPIGSSHVSQHQRKEWNREICNHHRGQETLVEGEATQSDG
jgi:hypothetical protein